MPEVVKDEIGYCSLLAGPSEYFSGRFDRLLTSYKHIWDTMPLGIECNWQTTEYFAQLTTNRGAPTLTSLGITFLQPDKA